MAQALMQKRILIVEDDKDISVLIRYNLDKTGYLCEQIFDGALVMDALARFTPDLVLLDVMLPGCDGFEVCRQLKKDERFKDVPVLFLTAKGDELDRVVGLELGADDYVVKPFSPRELVLRIKAVLRRREHKESPSSAFCYGNLAVDFSKIQVLVKGVPLNLAAKEFELLSALIKARGRVLSRDHLLDTIWGYDKAVEIQTRTVDVHIRTLRKKLKTESARIVTVKGYGYRFDMGKE